MMSDAMSKVIADLRIKDHEEALAMAQSAAKSLELGIDHILYARYEDAFSAIEDAHACLGMALRWLGELT